MLEKSFRPQSGYQMLLLCLIFIGAGAFGIHQQMPALIIPSFLGFAFILPGFMIINPNESRVLTLFGKYAGTVKENGFFWANPFMVKRLVSLRAFNLNGQSLKVNDKTGNPIDIAAVIVWQVQDTAKAIFEVNDYTSYVNIQSEAAVRHLANSCPYDNWEDNEAVVTLRGTTEKVHEMLLAELNERLGKAGIHVIEARISHLAYAPEIAGAMLQRQQASAVVAARQLIVEGAVGMVEMALAKLSEKEIVHLDEERKANMVSNLLVVLCGDRNVSPVINAGTIY
ncbi:MAG TPA: SPFH domain-containing protein [Bacteroidia bacterium]|nr:SPFH domain-containing protein [Bacteroidia bacterium]